MNNTTMNENCTNDDCIEPLLNRDYIRYPFMAMYIIVFAVCFLGNLLTIAIILLHPRMKTATNFFLGHLAFADLLVSLFCIIQNMVHIVASENANWVFGEPLCRLYLGLIQVVPCISIGILVAVSLEKYIAVLHPLTALKILTKRLRYMVCIGIWCGSILINFPFFYYTKMKTFNGEENGLPVSNTACYRESMPVWITASFVIWYVIPLIVLAGLYAQIGKLLWKSSSNPTSTRQSSDSQSGSVKGWRVKNGKTLVINKQRLLEVPTGEEKLKDKKKPKEFEGRRKVIRLLLIVVLSFAITTFPHHARLLFKSWHITPVAYHTNDSIASLSQPIAYLFLFISSAINPILYAFLSKRFRGAVVDFFLMRKVFKQSVVNCLACFRDGVFKNISSRSRTRTLVSDLPQDDSRDPDPTTGIRLNRIRA